MKTFLSFVLFIITASAVVFAQSETSTTKTIISDINGTEPMIAVNPVDPNNFIAVYSKWVSGSRNATSSMTTNAGESWISAQVPNDIVSDKADPTIAFDTDGNAYYCYLEV